MGRAHPRGPGPLPKSLSRWLRATLVANGVAGPLPLSLAIDVAQVLVETGRAIPAPKWVDELIASRDRQDYQQMARSVMGR